jgi:uncharacterized protein
MDHAWQQRDKRHRARQAGGRGTLDKVCREGLTTSPQYWFSDDERVVVLAQVTLAGERADSVDVLTFRDGKMVKFQTAGDTAMLERIFGSK